MGPCFVYAQADQLISIGLLSVHGRDEDTLAGLMPSQKPPLPPRPLSRMVRTRGAAWEAAQTSSSLNRESKPNASTQCPLPPHPHPPGTLPLPPSPLAPRFSHRARPTTTTWGRTCSTRRSRPCPVTCEHMRGLFICERAGGWEHGWAVGGSVGGWVGWSVGGWVGGGNCRG